MLLRIFFVNVIKKLNLFRITHEFNEQIGNSGLKVPIRITQTCRFPTDFAPSDTFWLSPHTNGRTDGRTDEQYQYQLIMRITISQFA